MSMRFAAFVESRVLESPSGAAEGPVVVTDHTQEGSKGTDATVA